MSTHSTVDALMRTCLQSPCDDTPLLILADWLDEAGTDAAWTGYLRAKVEGDRHQPGTPASDEFQAIATQQAPLIEARLNIPFVGKDRSLLPFLRILPAPNITVNIGEAEVPTSVIELMPESVARENEVVPVESVERTLVVVAVEPHTALVEKLEFILNREVVIFRGVLDDIAAAINRHYGNTETESVDCISYESPMIGLQGDTGEIYGIFYTAFSSGATGFEMHRSAEESTIRYIRAGGPSEAEHLSRLCFDRLLTHCLEEAATEPRYSENGLHCVSFDVPLLSNRRFPVTLELKILGNLMDRLRGRRTDWFRLRFHWERREPSR